MDLGPQKGPASLGRLLATFKHHLQEAAMQKEEKIKLVRDYANQLMDLAVNYKKCADVAEQIPEEVLDAMVQTAEQTGRLHQSIVEQNDRQYKGPGNVQKPTKLPKPPQDMQKARSKPYLVFAHTVADARMWACAMGLKRYEWSFISRADQLMGERDYPYVILSSFARHPHKDHLRDRLQFPAFGFYQVDKETLLPIQEQANE